MSDLEKYIENSDCNMGECPNIEVECDDCIKKMLEEHDAKVRQDFAEKIRAHMTKYCHARLEQQYCAMEVIDFIGKLLGEKDFSIDVEEEMKKHDAKVRQDAIDNYTEWLDRAHADFHEGYAEDIESDYIDWLKEYKNEWFS